VKRNIPIKIIEPNPGAKLPIISTLVDIMGNFAPGLGSIIFIGIFLFTLFKEGLYPLKEKVSYFLNFDKTGMLIK